MAAHTMTPARKAALRKAQMASARKRRRGGTKSSKKRNIKRAALVAGAVTAAGTTGYVAYRHRAEIKKHAVATKAKTKASVKKHTTKAKAAVHKKVENNHTARTAAVKHLRGEVSKRRPPQKGLKMAPKYRMGRPEVRRRRKAARHG